jgi:single-strand DNA-binding protein
MNNLNKVMLIGRLGKDPEVRTFEGGATKAAFPLATSEVYKDKNGQRTENTQWHNIVCWRGLAEIAEKYLRKGANVYVEGKITSRSWDDKDGNKRYTTEIVADNFIMLDKKSDSGNGGGSYEQQTSSAGSEGKQESAPAGDNISDDLPF